MLDEHRVDFSGCRGAESIVNILACRSWAFWCRWIAASAVTLFLFSSISVVASSSSDVAPELLRNSRLVFEQQPAEMEYRVVLSSIKKVNSRWRAEQQDVVEGLVSRKTYELDRLMSYQSAERLLRDSLQKSERPVLFKCDGLDCGSSNGWANVFLQIKQLYGLDTYQYYAVLGGSADYTVFYLIQRGSERIYLQVDHIVLPQKGTGSRELQQALNGKGYWVVRGAESVYRPTAGEEPQPYLLALHEWLTEDRSRKVLIVGHAQISKDVSGADQESLAFAERIKKVLLDMGVQDNQLLVAGVGGKAPRPGVAGDRVEVVVLP